MLAALNLDRFLLLVRVLTTLNQLMALKHISSGNALKTDTMKREN